MALITKPNTFTVGATIVSSEHNSNFDTIYNDYNGNITNNNVSASAGIVDTKLAQITTASKVSGTALTLLANIPSGAGDIPSVNLDGNAVVLTGTQTVAGVKTFSSIPLLPASNPTTDNQAVRKLFYDTAVNIEDYGTSTSASTTKNLSDFFICYGSVASISAGGTQAITNLPFTSSSSYVVTVSSKNTGSDENAGILGVANNTGAQFTISNTDNAVKGCNWRAEGT